MPINLDDSLRVDPADLPGEGVLFGSTAAMRAVRDRIERVRLGDQSVLIQGESGTGKELIARFLHAHSTRRNGPFVRLSCAAVPLGLQERELFGYEKGALPKAPEGRVGLVEAAVGGTLFLSEIGNMGLELQDKLLRLLRDGSFVKVGGREERKARARVVCATNVDLGEAVASGSFRAALFDHIAAVSLQLSPLRERKSDLPRLCEYFLEKLSRQFQRSAPKLSADTIHLLKQWNWPGNLLELKNWISRAIILGDDEPLVTELRRRIETLEGSADRVTRKSSRSGATERGVSGVTSALILKALQANRWNRRKTAEELKMSYRALVSGLRSVGIPQRRRSHKGPPQTH
ncbi:MAG TPA: sigma 54-interacting transcriptional regulator [Terracidiphilus sp.]|nr:sigma 54-interacting transcriptional regulator [Terracidiphilus sp.]